MIVSTETGGLGNRLKSWVSSMRLDADARVHWPVTKNMPARVWRLVRQRLRRRLRSARRSGLRLLAARRSPSRTSPTCPPVSRPSARARTRSFAGLAKPGGRLTGERTDRYRFMVFPKQHSRRSTRADARHIDLEYERIPRYFRDVYGELFRPDRRASEIAAAAADWAAANLDRDSRRRASANVARRRPPTPQVSPAVVAALDALARWRRRRRAISRRQR